MSDTTAPHAHCPACGEYLPTTAEFVAEISKPSAENPHFTLQAPAEVMQLIIACALAGVAIANRDTTAAEIKMHLAFLPLAKIMDEKNFASAEAALRAMADAVTKDSQEQFSKKLDGLLANLFSAKPKGF
jgi:uncharacterized membrane protein